MKFALKLVVASVAVACAGTAFAQKGEVVKMVRIDAQSGLLGPVGVSQLKGYQFFAEKFSGAGNPAGVKSASRLTRRKGFGSTGHHGIIECSSHDDCCTVAGLGCDGQALIGTVGVIPAFAGMTGEGKSRSMQLGISQTKKRADATRLT